MFKTVLLSPLQKVRCCMLLSLVCNCLCILNQLGTFLDHMKIFYHFTLLFNECSMGVCFKKERQWLIKSYKCSILVFLCHLILCTFNPTAFTRQPFFLSSYSATETETVLDVLKMNQWLVLLIKNVQTIKTIKIPLQHNFCWLVIKYNLGIFWYGTIISNKISISNKITWENLCY